MFFNYQSIHLPFAEDVSVKWDQPHESRPGLWIVHLEVSAAGYGLQNIAFFGTEEQVKAIAKGCDGFLEEPTNPDPTQLDALEVKPASLSAQEDMVDYATRIVMRTPGHPAKAVADFVLDNEVAKW